MHSRAPSQSKPLHFRYSGSRKKRLRLFNKEKEIKFNTPASPLTFVSSLWFLLSPVGFSGDIMTRFTTESSFPGPIESLFRRICILLQKWEIWGRNIEQRHVGVFGELAEFNQYSWVLPELKEEVAMWNLERHQWPGVTETRVKGGSTWRLHLGKRMIRSREPKRMRGGSQGQDYLSSATTTFIKWVSATKMSENAESGKSERNSPSPTLSSNLVYGSSPENRMDSTAKEFYHTWSVLGTTRSMMSSEVSASLFFFLIYLKYFYLI